MWMYCLLVLVSFASVSQAIKCQKCEALQGGDCNSGQCEGQYCTALILENKAAGTRQIKKDCTSNNPTGKQEDGCLKDPTPDGTDSYRCACNSGDFCNGESNVVRMQAMLNNRFIVGGGPTGTGPINGPGTAAGQFPGPQIQPGAPNQPNPIEQQPPPPNQIPPTGLTNFTLQQPFPGSNPTWPHSGGNPQDPSFQQQPASNGFGNANPGSVGPNGQQFPVGGNGSPQGINQPFPSSGNNQFPPQTGNNPPPQFGGPAPQFPAQGSNVPPQGSIPQGQPGTPQNVGNPQNPQFGVNPQFPQSVPGGSPNSGPNPSSSDSASTGARPIPNGQPDLDHRNSVGDTHSNLAFGGNNTVRAGGIGQASVPNQSSSSSSPNSGALTCACNEPSCTGPCKGAVCYRMTFAANSVQSQAFSTKTGEVEQTGCTDDTNVLIGGSNSLHREKKDYRFKYNGQEVIVPSAQAYYCRDKDYCNGASILSIASSIIALFLMLVFALQRY